MDTVIWKNERERWQLVFSFLATTVSGIVAYDYAASQGYSEGFFVVIGIAVFLTVLVSISKLVEE